MHDRLDDLRVRLLRHGYPRRYVRRVIDELADHRESIVSSLSRNAAPTDDIRMLADERLGETELIYDSIISRLALSWRAKLVHRIVEIARAYPFITFVLLPVPLAAMLAGVCALVGIASFRIIVDLLHVPHLSMHSFVTYGFYTPAYALTPLLAIAYAALARRTGASIRLAIIPALLLSAAGGYLKLDLVHCLASDHIAYFQRYGIDAIRLFGPIGAFIGYTIAKTICSRAGISEYSFQN